MTLLIQSGETAYHDQVHVVRVSSLGPLTAINLSPGRNDDQCLYVINEGSFTIGLDPQSALTYKGESCHLESWSAVQLIWNASVKLWLKW